ncbi:hypothetical protein BH20CHL6_BH20CHL6_09390 [soil metagenome]
MSGSRRLRSASLATALVLAATLAGTARAGGGGFSFDVLLNDTCVSGTGPADTGLAISLRTFSGHLRDRFRTTTDGDGNWVGCFRLGVRGGNVIKALGGGSSESWRIPKITLDTERVSDVVSGLGPENTTLALTVVHYPGFASGREISVAEREVTTDGDGDYSTDFSDAVAIVGGDQVSALLQQDGNRATIVNLAPRMGIFRNDDVAFGNLNPGDPVHVELRRADGSLKAQLTSPGFFSNFWDGILYAPDGTSVAARPGDVLWSDIASDSRFTLPVMALNGSATRDTVYGRCMPNRPYEVIVVRESLTEFVFESFRGRTNGAGRFVKEVSARVDLQRGDRLTLECKFATGDLVGRLNSAGG